MRAGRPDIPPFLVGVASIPAQAILLRELLSRGAGNELSLTLYLAIWLGGSAIGARIWGRVAGRSERFFTPSIVVGMLIVIGSVLLARFAPLPGVVPGEVPGPLAIGLFGLVVLFLAAFFTAGLFPLAARNSPSAGRAYVAEAIGALVGGLATTLLFVERVPPLAIVGIVGAVVIVGAVRKPITYAAAAILMLAAVAGVIDRIDNALFSRAWELRHPGLELKAHAATPTRVLTLSEREGEQWLFSDDSPREVLNDPYRDDRISALLLSVAPKVESILLIDFGAAYVAPVLSGAGVDRVACLLPEPEDTLLVPPAPGVVCHIGDPRRGLRNVQDTWDVIAMSGAEAVTVGSNRLWTVEAFKSMAERLSSTGVVVAIAPGGEAAPGSETISWRASVAEAMREAIGPTKVIDADDFIFVASRDRDVATLDPDTLANRYLSAGRLLETYPAIRFGVEFPRDRHRSLDAAPANTDFRPAAFAHAIARWARRAGLPARPPGFLPVLIASLGALLFVAPLFRRRTAARDGTIALIATGAASMGLDLLVLMAYQARVGVLQGGMGLLFGLFLGGSAIGAALALRVPEQSMRGFLIRVCLIQAVLILGATFLLPRFPLLPTVSATILYGLVACMLGVTCGLPFPLIARLSSAAHAWAADAIGGIFGAILVLAFVGWGIVVVGLALAALPLLATTRFLGSRGYT